MTVDIENQVFEIVSRQTGLKIENIFLGSRIEQDLNMIGDDVWEILEAIYDKFKTDFKEMDFSLYFTGEAEGLFHYLLNIKKCKDRKKYPVTVGHLVKVVEHGKWFKPEQVK